MTRRNRPSRPSFHTLAATAPVLIAALLAVVSAPAKGAPPGLAPLDDARRCQAAVAEAEVAAHVAPGLMGAISIVESGRLDARTGRVAPWPWTINVAGVGYFFASRDEAIAAVQAAQAAGTQSIDVGCMQVNLLHHPQAFASLTEAFDPAANTAYAALFLSRLHARSGAWPDAAASYHSSTPDVAAPYLVRVMAAWPASGRYAPVAVTAPGNDNRLPALRSRMMEAAADHDALAAAGFLPSTRSIAGANRHEASRSWAMLSRSPARTR